MQLASPPKIHVIHLETRPSSPPGALALRLVLSVFLSFLQNGVSAYAVEGIFNIKFEENFVVVRLVHEVMGGMDCSFTPQGGSYPYFLGGRRSLRSLGINKGSQADFLATRRR